MCIQWRLKSACTFVQSVQRIEFEDHDRMSHRPLICLMVCGCKDKHIWKIFVRLDFYLQSIPGRLHMKFDFNPPSDFRGEDVWKCWQTTDYRWRQQNYSYYKLTSEPKAGVSLKSTAWPFFHTKAEVTEFEPRVIIWTNLVGPNSQCCIPSFKVICHSVPEEIFKRFFTIYGHCGHLGRVTKVPWTNCLSPIPYRLHM